MTSESPVSILNKQGHLDPTLVKPEDGWNLLTLMMTDSRVRHTHWDDRVQTTILACRQLVWTGYRSIGGILAVSDDVFIAKSIADAAADISTSRIYMTPVTDARQVCHFNCQDVVFLDGSTSPKYDIVIDIPNEKQDLDFWITPTHGYRERIQSDGSILKLSLDWISATN